ncbi:LPXTG cell wall anchor domain-containing protein [Dolosicoccus paucivorans]
MYDTLTVPQADLPLKEQEKESQEVTTAKPTKGQEKETSPVITSKVAKQPKASATTKDKKESQKVAQANTLPNTGDKEVTLFGLITFLSGLGLTFTRRRREN